MADKLPIKFAASSKLDPTSVTKEKGKVTFGYDTVKDKAKIYLDTDNSTRIEIQPTYAEKLATDGGTSTKPIYIKDGVPTVISLVDNIKGTDISVDKIPSTKAVQSFVEGKGYVTTDTWKPNTATQEGYVRNPNSAGVKVWATDDQGVPGWQDLMTVDLTSAGIGTAAKNNADLLEGKTLDYILKNATPALYMPLSGGTFTGNVSIAKGSQLNIYYGDNTYMQLEENEGKFYFSSYVNGTRNNLIILDSNGNISDGQIKTIADTANNAMPKSGGIFTGKLVVSTSAMPIASGKISGMSYGTTEIYRDGVAISNPMTSNDVAWLRVTGTGESDTVLEIATGDDGGGGEQIIVRQYNTSNTVSHSMTLLDNNGNTVVQSSNKSGYYVRNIWCGDANSKAISTNYIWTKRK